MQSPPTIHQLKRLALGGVLLAVVFCGIPVAGCLAMGALGGWLNDRLLGAFADHLYAYPLPPDTEVLDRHAEYGKVGNSNNCWYRAEQSMASALSPAEIAAYYEGVTLPRIAPPPDDPIYADVPRATEVRVTFDEAASAPGRTHFTLSLFDVGFTAALEVCY